MTVKTQLCLCNIQGVYTNVSANYMFRPFPVRPSSGWTIRVRGNTQKCKIIIKVGGGRDLVYKIWGVYVQTGVCTYTPTTCFGLFQLGHLQVGHKGQRKYPKMQNYH